MSVRNDRFGNLIDPAVSYARGTILAGEMEESQRQGHGFELVRARFAREGDKGVYNLTGLIRGFPLQESDREWLKSYIHFAGPGLAVTGEDLLTLALERAPGRRSALVPVEAVAVASFAMMERDGIVTIPVAGMPGAASVFRLMMFPDGKRLGDERLLASARHALETLSAVVDDAQRARVMLMGHG